MYFLVRFSVTYSLIVSQDSSIALNIWVSLRAKVKGNISVVYKAAHDAIHHQFIIYVNKYENDVKMYVLYYYVRKYSTRNTKQKSLISVQNCI